MTRFDRLLPAAGIVAAMSLVASLAFRPVFDAWWFVVAPVMAVAGATAVGLFALRRELLLGETLGALRAGIPRGRD
jgi:hypothetical protein